MRTLLLVLVLVSCTGALLADTAVASQPTLPALQAVSSTPPADNGPGSYDPYLGQGNLITKAVPVCCCSFGVCEDQPPGNPCLGGPNVCHCNASHACVRF